MSLSGALPALQDRSRDSRDRILEAAEEAFSENGFAGAKLTDIAERAGLAVGTIYNRFTDKDGLFTAVLDNYVRTTRYLIETGVDWEGQRKSPAGDILQNFVFGSFENLLRNKGLMRAIIERSLSDPSAYAPLAGLADNVEDRFHSLLRLHPEFKRSSTLRSEISLAFRLINGTFMDLLVRGQLTNHSICQTSVHYLTELLVARFGCKPPSRKRTFDPTHAMRIRQRPPPGDNR
ncbi:MAG: TetR/AcrR family transcriptional regulator [Alphaproteobacteria bacterium]|nr:TetR/AcrR family transcriptional regulator [Alphaproteobacteria bacterium]